MPVFTLKAQKLKKGKENARYKIPVSFESETRDSGV